LERNKLAKFEKRDGSSKYRAKDITIREFKNQKTNKKTKKPKINNPEKRMFEKIKFI